MTVDLATTYLGLELRSPLIASASPLTASVETLVALERAGAGAVVLPSLFEEQIERDETGPPVLGRQDAGDAIGYLPDGAFDANLASYAEHVAAAKQALSIPVIASVNGFTPGGWVHYADALQTAGADAIELNVYAVETDPYASAASVEDRTLRLVSRVRSAISVPLAVKVGPFYTAFANMAQRLADARADGLVLFNRFLQPDIDLGTLTVEPQLHLSEPDELRLPLRWVAILAGRVPTSLAATSGVRTADDVVKLTLAGADAVMVASELLRRGPVLFEELTEGLRQWLDAHGHASLRQVHGTMSQIACGNPGAFERAHYVRSIVEYRAREAQRAAQPVGQSGVSGD